MCQVQVPANVRAGTLSLLTGALEIKPLMLQVTPVYSAEMSQKYQLRNWWLIGGFSAHRRRATRHSKGRIFIPPFCFSLLWWNAFALNAQTGFVTSQIV